MSGVRGRDGPLFATTAESNIFLLTLCLGMILVTGCDNKKMEESFVSFELLTAWASAVALLITVVVGGRWWMGALLLCAYI
jgi:hypothetical protein